MSLRGARPNNVIARSPQATRQSYSIVSGKRIAAPFGLAMTRLKSTRNRR